MDKKSNRTDMLAAGRKRLQQFRQKKDSKGKDGKTKPVKSTSKSISGAENSEQHGDDDGVVQTSVDAPTELLHFPERESHLHLDSDLSALVPTKNAEESALNELIDGPIAVPLLDDKGKTKELSLGAVDLSVEDSEVKETSSSSDNHCSVTSREMENLQIDPVGGEGAVSFGIPTPEADNADSYPSTSLASPSASADEDGVTPATVEVDVLKREDQVSSDVGAMQEVNSSGSEDSDRSSKLEQQEDAKLCVPVVDEGAEFPAFPWVAPENLIASEQKNSLQTTDSDPPCIVADEGDDMRKACISLSSSADGQSFNLVKLVDVIKGLSEDDFMFLINSRNLVKSDSDALQKHLYLANIFKEFFHLQLLDASKHESDIDHKHKQLADKISMLTASLAGVSQRNRSLEAAFVQCRSELTAAIFQKEELQSQCHLGDSEVKELSSKVDELKIIIEESSRGLSKLSEELNGCKLQLADSQAENERLVNTLVSVTDQKNKEMEVKEQLLDEKGRELAGCRSTITALQVEIASLNISLAFVTDERMKVEEEKQFLSAKNEKLSVDLADCKSLLDALEEQRSKLNANLAELRERRGMIEEMNDNLVRENERLSHEVSSHQQSLSKEHAQYMQLEDDLKEARLRLEQLMEENVTLSSTMEIYKTKVADISNRHLISSSQERVVGTQYQGHAGEAEADSLQYSPRNPVTEALSSVLFKPASNDCEDRIPFNNLKGSIYDDSSGFVILKGHLEEAERLLQDLEKAMGGMYSHSLTLSPSIGKSAAPGISKLIQAFEPKAHSDENESEASEITDRDLYMSAKHHTGCLGLLLKTMYQDILHASNFARAEKEGCESASASIKELVVEVESWKDCCANMELHNIELEVQFEVLKQHMYSTGMKQIELETSYEALRGEEASLRAQNIQLGGKLNDYYSRSSELFVQLDEVRKSSREIASIAHDDLEELRKDVMEKVSEVEGALVSSYSLATQVVEKLDAALGSPAMPPNLASSADGLGIDGQLLVSVDATCQMIEDLKERLEAASRENKTLSSTCEERTTKLNALTGENKSAVELLEKIFSDLVNCLKHSRGHVKESETQPEEARIYDALNASHFETIIKQLSSLLNERQQLKELNEKLNSELLNRKNDVEEPNKRSSDSDLLLKLVEDIRDVLKLPPAELDSNESSIILFQSLFSLFVGKYKEADDSVRFLKDDLNSRMMELRELQGYVESLNSFNFQQQNEIIVLKESLKQAKDAFDVTRDELLVKVTELEHSEQRFTSIREKLSIAVAKGKGLIVQRDNLKQSLSETSSELERCSQELQLKEARLNEAEDKLKAYSEAGERVEALESELSYIRNSATALRESFLLKDSALQRIEEILEDLELPEQFHSRDIVEKVAYLAKSVAANSLVAADLEQRSSIGGGSYTDAGIVITDSWKDDAQPSSNIVEDLQRQNDEMQKRFYALAEQNERLEQSLIERNNLVQRWEGVLDRIDTPVQIRSMEPDERIQWLGTALSEADHHMSSLQQKVDHLESFCGSISADLEEAQRQISELEFSLQTVTHERNNLEQSLMERSNLVQRWEEVLDRVDMPPTIRSMEAEEKIQWLGTALSQADHHMKSLQQKVESLETYCKSTTANLQESQTRISELQLSLQMVNHEKETLTGDLVSLSSEHENALERTAQFKQDADDLRSEVDALREKLAEKLETEKHILQIEGQMLRWRDLIIGTMQSCGTESLIPDGSSPGESLEILIQRLVDEYGRFSKEIHERKEAVDHSIPDLAADLDKKRVISPVGVHEDDNTNSYESRARDTMVEDVQSTIELRRDLDVTISELEYLKEERDVYKKKSQCLVSELEELEKKKEELQNLLNQEEQKSASFREKLNVAVRKGKSLVQHRDALKQSIEGFTAEIDRLKSELDMRENSIVVFEQKVKDLSSQIESGHILQSENTSLRNQLMEITQLLQERDHSLSLLLQKLGEINIDSELEVSNPVQKLEEIQKLCSNLHGAVVSSEQETKKAKRAAELLLAELNEVQERNDNLQEDLAEAYKQISDITKQKDVAESAKLQVLARLQDLSEETRNQRAEYDLLKPTVHKLERGFLDVSSVIADVFANDMDLLHRLRANMESCAKAIGSDLQLSRASGVLMSWISKKEGYLAKYSFQGFKVLDQSDDDRVHLSQLTKDIELFKEQICSDSLSLRGEAEMLLNFIGNLHSEVISLKMSLDSMKAEFLHLESTEKKRDMDCAIMRQGMSLLYEACCNSIMEIESRRAQLVGNNLPFEDLGAKLKALPLADGGLNISEQNLLTSTEHVKSLGDRLLLAVTDFITTHARSMESDHKEMRATISDLQKELQEKDIQKERMCMELVSQIKAAEATATGYSCDLQTAKLQVHDLEKRLLLLEEERNSLENIITDLQQKQVDSVELQDKVSSLTDVIAAKEQEIEALMQALDEEENQMEGLKAKIEELELDVNKKSLDLEQAVAGRARALKKLSITVSKFDELHHMSEGLLSEIENLQTQLQDRESEISFLRQEVTRCTNDVLLASKTVKERNANELQELFTWLETSFSQFVVQGVHSSDNHNNQSIKYKDLLQKSITSIISELEELRVAAQRKDASLQMERKRVEELLHAKEALEASLCEKESHLSSLLSAGEAGQSTSEIVEVESVINKWVAPVTSTASQVRSLRKSNNEQVAIAIDADTTDSGRLEDEDDDKVHGFKSLTTSRFVPKFTRPVSDMIDGLWVSCDRALMRQPGLRLGIMIYWAILHALFATFVV